MQFEPVRPRLTEILLQYLKEHNHLYRNIKIDIENIPEELLPQISNTSEENAYLVKNITNPIDISIDSLVGNKDHEEINPSGTRISGILDDDCMNQEMIMLEVIKNVTQRTLKIYQLNSKPHQQKKPQKYQHYMNWKKAL